MNALCEHAPSTTRPPHEAQSNSEGRPCLIAARCRALLDEARALGLDLEDVIDALRRSPSPRDSSN